MTMRGGIWAVVPEGATANETTGPTASLRYVTPGFFDTMQIPLRAGTRHQRRRRRQGAARRGRQ